MGRRRRGWRQVGVLLLLIPLLLASSGCGPFGMPQQGNGLPTLRQLDWGNPYNTLPYWSPDGRWIAVVAGEDAATEHLEVVSPDGRVRHDLSSWGCDTDGSFNIAWLPDGRLSCTDTVSDPAQRCLGAAPFTRCQRLPLPERLNIFDGGMAWTPDGSFLILAAEDADAVASGAGGAPCAPDECLWVLDPAGHQLQRLLPGVPHGVSRPAWAPPQAGQPLTLAYYRGTSGDNAVGDLVIRQVSRAPAVQAGPLMLGPLMLGPLMLGPLMLGPLMLGPLMLGPPQTIAGDQDEASSLYAWAPSGHWMAVQVGDYNGGDKIELVNPSNPSQIVDVAVTDKLGLQMTNPIWSPDGQTLIVFSVEPTEAHPYAIDIASYLQSKGLQL